MFQSSSDLILPCSLPWLSPVFNSPPFSLFTTTKLSTLSQPPPFYQLLTEAKIYAYTKENDSTPFSSQNVIYDPTQPVPKPDFTSSAGRFHGWFGIPFLSPLSFTHVRTPHLTEILKLYEVSAMIPLYSTLLSSIQIRSLVLHIIPLPIMHHLSHSFLSHTVPPIIPSSIRTKYVHVNT